MSECSTPQRAQRLKSRSRSNKIRESDISNAKRTQSIILAEDKPNRPDAFGFNCEEKGHFWPSSPWVFIRFGKCKRVGHTAAKCVKSPSSDKRQIGSSSNKNVMKIQAQETLGHKYYKNVKVNGQVSKEFIDLGSE